MTKRIFVFGSNIGGRHGKGAAQQALQNHGAIYGQGEGLQGESYAIPTKGIAPSRYEPMPTLPLHQIEWHVIRFLIFAREHPEMMFHVTRIGCGLAGYTDEQIAPMFFDAPTNCILPSEWQKMRFFGKVAPVQVAYGDPEAEKTIVDQIVRPKSDLYDSGIMVRS